MNYPQPPPLPTDFRMAAGGFRRMIVPFIAMLAFFFVVMLLLGSALTGTLGGGIAIGAGATLVMSGVLYLKFKRAESGALLRFTPYGVEHIEGNGLHVRLAWPDVVQIGQVQTQMANPKQVSGGGAVAVGVGSLKSVGIIGWGDRTMPAKAPDWLCQQMAAQPRHPVDGRPMVAIPVGQFDPQWLNGAMGEWVRRFRPDVLPPPAS